MGGVAGVTLREQRMQKMERLASHQRERSLKKRCASEAREAGRKHRAKKCLCGANLAKGRSYCAACKRVIAKLTWQRTNAKVSLLCERRRTHGLHISSTLLGALPVIRQLARF